MYSPASLIGMLARTAKLDVTLSHADVSAYVQEDNSGSTFITDTTDANDTDANDVAIPDPFDTNDAMYVGYTSSFSSVSFSIGTLGVGDDVSSEVIWEYSNGRTWESLDTTYLTDSTGGLTASGTVTFRPPANWGKISVNSQGPYYYIRMRSLADDVYNTTQPLISEVAIAGGSDDRILALEWLQDAADLVVADLDLLVPAQATVTLTAGQSEYALDASPFPTDMLRVLSVYLSDTTVTSYPMTQLTLDQIDSRHTGSQANSTPFEYGVDWPRFRMYPAPQANSTILLRYAQDGAATLVDDETTITWLPRHLQKGCLFSYAMARALEYKKDHIAADRWEAKFYNDRAQGLPAARRWKASGGGRQGPQMGAGAPVATVPSQDIGGLH